MDNGNSISSPSVFRTRSWVQAWVDTWGKHPGIELIDLGGRHDPLEMLYKTTVRLKRWLPARTLCLAGIGVGEVHTPRSEYNHMDELVQQCGGIVPLMNELRTLRWDQFLLPDLLVDAPCHQQIHALSRRCHWPVHVEREEPAYHIEEGSFEQYCMNLSANVRRTYFNQRQRLESRGTLQRERWPLNQLLPFIRALNNLHITRWGNPCYSEDSMRFMHLFTSQLQDEGGEIVMEVLRLDGTIISVLFDIVWQNTRYNLQSGYKISGYPGLSLGALHLGYAIEESLMQGYRYDFLAGQGKSTDYKRRIANKTLRMQTVIQQKVPVAALRKLNNLLSTRN